MRRCLCSLFILVIVTRASATAQTRAVVIEPLFFRSQAVSAPHPEFAAGAVSVPSTTVRVVLELHVTAVGTVRSVRVLDEGLRDLAAVSASTVQRWQFQRFEEVFPNLKPIERVGRVILYFNIGIGKRVTVLDAAEARLASERLKRKAMSESPN